MDKSNYDKRLMEYIAAARYYKSSVLILSIALLLMGIKVFMEEDSVILLPPRLDERIKVSEQMADSGYKKAWSTYIATLAGNVNPANVQFVADSVLQFVSSDVYQRLSGEFGSQVFKIQQEARRTRFTPTKVLYDEEIDRVFVVGEYEVMLPSNQSVSSSAKGTSIRKDKVYELVIEMNDGQPLVKHFDTYFGPVKDKSYRARNKGDSGE